MVNNISINEKWSKTVANLAAKFNDYADKHSLRMVGFIVDKAFEIVSDDKDPDNVDAAYLLQSIREKNPSLITSYVSELIDAKIGKSILEDRNYIIPDYMKYPITDKDGEVIVVNEENNKNEKQDSDEILDAEKESAQNIASELINWNMMELMKFNVMKNLTKVTYDEIKSRDLKKCACGDGVFEKNDINIWMCTECKTAYHENCAKIVALLEGYCRICGEPLLVDEPSEAEKDDKDDLEQDNKNKDKNDKDQIRILDD